jgi:quercetin 2,3-dioxygenase
VRFLLDLPEFARDHKDSMGTGSVIRSGDVQRMSAGTGVVHSELNASKTDPVHFLQIWVLPELQNMAPGYEQKHFAAKDKQGRLRVVASPDGRDQSVTIHADVVVRAGIVDRGERVELALSPDRHAWVHVAEGNVKVNGKELHAGDGAALSNESLLLVEGVDHGEVLVFDLA